jgi:molybdopterin molybdotransferase
VRVLTVALLSVAEALERVLAQAAALPAEEAPLAEAYGRVLAADLKALRTQPPADVSAMDGYAVRSADVANVPAQLAVIGEVAAGRPFARTLGAGEAARIFTGGVMPAGADTVVIQEHAKRDGDRVEVEKSAAKGRHIRVEGLDFKAGETLLTAGRRLTARDLALAAAMNHPRVPVHRRPKLAVFATGDELVPPGTQPAPGQIVSSNTFALAALARAEGAQVEDLGIIADRLDATVAAVRRARERGVDILLSSGGASVGDYDLVQKAFTAEGMTLSFWKLALRPGRPLMHGRLGAIHVLGVPGNPVSAFVCALLFLVPLIRRLAGRGDLAPRKETALLGCDLPENDERADYLRATLKQSPDGEVVTAFPIQDSSMMAPLAKADCLLVREPFAPPAKAGSRCTIIRLEH